MADNLKVGDLAIDQKRHRLGRVAAFMSGLVFLRPPGGGLEWTAHSEDLRRPRASEVIARVPSDRVEHERTV